MTITLLAGDCRELLATLPADSVDSCVTDPPYGLNFMGKVWDSGAVAFDPATWRAIRRALKPGAHLVAFGGTRTYHRLAAAIEDAGFEIRDQLAWLYGSGFPKSLNLPGGIGTALKPALEPIVLARKPLIGTVATNVTRHGTGALNIDGCRVEAVDGDYTHSGNTAETSDTSKVYGWAKSQGKYKQSPPHTIGRWPANVCHDGSDEVLEAFAAFGGRGQASPIRGDEPSECHGGVYSGPRGRVPFVGRDDTGTAARFFFSAKASSAERNAGLEGLPTSTVDDGRRTSIDNPYQRGETLRRNIHPTVKPIALMAWLCRLVTPPGGLVLDPFLGSGSTAIAADREGLSCIGIELDPDYLEIARARIAGDAGLFADLR